MSATLKLIPEAVAAAERAPAKNAPSDTVVATPFAAPDLIARALESLGYKHRTYRGVLYAETGEEGSLFAFIRGSGAAMNAHFPAGTSLVHARHVVEQITDEYVRLVQEQVYARVMRTASEQGFVVESEEVDDDNTMVVTLRLPE